MATKTIDPARVEQDARARFADLTTAPPAVRDDHGVDHAPDARYVEIRRRARLIAVSDGLADAVLAHLAGFGVEAEADQVRVDPAESDEQVMAIRCPLNGSPAVVPLRPGATTLRGYPVTDDILLSGEPVTVDLPGGEADGWVTAAAIAEALKARG